jgi:hypothetical protein
MNFKSKGPSNFVFLVFLNLGLTKIVITYKEIPIYHITLYCVCPHVDFGFSRLISMILKTNIMSLEQRFPKLWGAPPWGGGCLYGRATFFA